MSNQNYSEFSERRANKNSAKKLKFRKGHAGAEHDSPHKDAKTAWPKAPGPRSRSLNRVNFHIVKTVVNSDGVDM